MEWAASRAPLFNVVVEEDDDDRAKPPQTAAATSASLDPAPASAGHGALHAGQSQHDYEANGGRPHHAPSAAAAHAPASLRAAPAARTEPAALQRTWGGCVGNGGRGELPLHAAAPASGVTDLRVGHGLRLSLSGASVAGPLPAAPLDTTRLGSGCTLKLPTSSPVFMQAQKAAATDAAAAPRPRGRRPKGRDPAAPEEAYDAEVKAMPSASAPPPPLPPPPSSTAVAAVSATPAERVAEARRRAHLRSRPHSLAACTDWWACLCYHDVHAIFTSQADAFEAPLRPLATASAGRFYAELHRCFAAWRRTHWDALVVLRHAAAGEPGQARRGRGGAQRTVRDPTLLEYANATWYEALRVQRLMAQHLLVDSPQEAGRVDEEGHVPRRGWRFEEGCFDALQCALGAPQPADAGAALCLAAPQAPLPATAPYIVRAASGAVGEASRTTTTTAPTTPVEVRLGGTATRALRVFVPTAARILALLRVLDTLWDAVPTSLPFRMPVSEMEAPGYYRSTRDPVSLCQLYEEVFAGMSVPAHRTCVKQQAQLARRVHEVLQAYFHHPHKSDTVAADVQASLFDYAHLRERLTTLKSNCDDYNGGGAELSLQATALLGAGVKALRDAQAAEDTWSKQPPVWTSLEDVSSSSFLHSEADTVVPPSLRAPPAIPAPDSSAAGGAPERRVLRLPTASSAPPTAAAATSAGGATTEFWIQCDGCDAWHKLAARLDPVPETWTCGSLGLACSAEKTRRKADKRAAKRAKKAAAKEEPRASRRESKRKPDSAAAAADSAESGQATAARRRGRPPREPRQPHALHEADGDDVLLADMYPVTASVVEDAPLQPATSTARKRGRPAKAAHERPVEKPQRARVALARRPPSVSSTSTSSSDSDSDSSSSSGSSSSSRTGASPRASSEQERPGEGAHVAKRSAVSTHALPKRPQFEADAGGSSRGRGGTSSGKATAARTAAALEEVAEAVAALERRPVQEAPFEQLEEIKRLERLLNALD